MTHKVFQRDDCQITVRWENELARIDWVASKDKQSLNELALEVKEFLLEQGVKAILTSVYAGDVDGEGIYRRASEFGFVPYEVVLQLVIDPTYQPES